MKSKRVKDLVLLSFFICVEIVLMLTPLGYVNIGPIRATTLHIPVIIASIIMGPKKGMIVGLVFGITSVIINTLTPTPASFLFSPFYSVGEFHGGFQSLIIALVPRVLLGLFSYYIYKFLLTFLKNEKLSIALSAFINTFIHTSLVMGGIYFFFKEGYAAIRNVPYDEVINVIMIVVTTNGVIEMILASIVVTAVCVALKHLVKE